ncbi:MAG TPA: hypothetical protein VGF79_11235, partial [Bacteroidia bacterium]
MKLFSIKQLFFVLGTMGTGAIQAQHFSGDVSKCPFHSGGGTFEDSIKTEETNMKNETKPIEGTTNRDWWP